MFPGVARGFLDLDSAVERGEPSLLFGATGRLIRWGSHPGDALEQVRGGRASCFDRAVGELREDEVHRRPEDERHHEQHQQYAAVGNGRPGNVNTRLAFRRHGGH